MGGADDTREAPYFSTIGKSLVLLVGSGNRACDSPS